LLAGAAANRCAAVDDGIGQPERSVGTSEAAATTLGGSAQRGRR